VCLRFLTHSSTQGDNIVLDGEFDPGVATRWTFFDITGSTFNWKAESRRAPDEPWVLDQLFAARRAGGSVRPTM
jgi:hypothetical protein